MIRNVFINPQEGRLRAGWRLLLQGLLYFVLLMGANVVLGIVYAFIAFSAGQNPQDPAVLGNLMASPAARVIGTVGSLLATVIAVLVAARWIDRRRWREYGFHFNRAWWADFAFGLVLGALLMGLIFAAELAAGWITVTGTLQSLSTMSFWGGIAAWVVVFLCVGIYEELLTRGYQLRNLAEGLNFRFFGPKTALLLAYLLTSIFFGLLHANNPNATPMSTINIMVAGLFLGLGYVLTGELALPIGLHITWNFFQGNVFGFPVSGMASPATFIAVEQGGPELWTGGPFGPEAGLIGLLAIALGSLLTVLWVRRQHGRAALREELAVYTPARRVVAAGADEPVPPVEVAPEPVEPGSGR